MGWKNIKEHYRIGHHVVVTDEGICIGSSYIHNLIVISLEGKILKGYEDARGNQKLLRYMEEMQADPAKLRELIAKPDIFGSTVPVFTYDGAKIIEERCEIPGWPNVTCTGNMMYDNLYSTDRDEVVKWARRDAELGVEFAKRRIKELEKKLTEARADLSECESILEACNAPI